MKATKQMKPSTNRETNAGTSIFKKSSSVLQGSSPSNSKIKRKIKFLANESEPLVLGPPSPGESMVKYSIPIPSENKPDMIDELQMLKDITDHLNELVHTMEYVYAKKVEEEEEEEEEEKEKEKESSVESLEDMTTFLLCFSSATTQLETASEEEKQILESLLKWFGKIVQQTEELGEDELIPDWQLPLADKDITNNIAKLVQRIQKLEELKGRVQDLPKSIQIPAAKQEKKKRASPVPSSHRDPKAILEDLVMKHATEDVVSMTHALEDDLTPQTIETMSTRILDIMKVFERQTNKLQRISNEQDVLEGKYQKIQNEYQLLAEEKQIMENELQKMREEEKLGKEKIIPESRKRFLSKLERKQPVEDAEVSSLSGVQAAGTINGHGGWEARRVSVVQSKKESENQKMKEDLIKAQENLQVLEREKKNLEEKLQKALEEAVKTNRQFTKSVTPSHVQDTHFIYPEADEENAGTDMKINGKDLSKKGKSPTKSKGKGEDHTFSRRKSINETDKSVQKLPAVDTGKQTGELLSRKTPVETEKNQETVTSQLKNVKLEKKVLTDKENAKDYGIPASSLKEKVLVQERELYKAKESAGVMEETPKLQFPQSESERVQYTHSTDKESLPLLPVKIKEESKGEKKHTEEKSETPLKLDPKGSTKPKKAAETKKGNLMRKSTGKETHITAVSDLPQLHKVQEESPLDLYSKSQDKSLPRVLDQLISARQEKISPEISQKKEAQVEATLNSSIQENPSLFTYENLTLPSTLIPKGQVSFKDVPPSHKVSSAKIKEESQTTPISPIETTPATISSKILEEVSAVFTPEDKMISTTTSSVKEDRVFLGDSQGPLEVYQNVHGHLEEFHKDQKFQVSQEDIQGLLKDHETIILENILPSEKSLPRIYKEAVDLKEDLSDTERLLLTNQLKNLNEIQQAQTLILVEAGQNVGKTIDDLSDNRKSLLANIASNTEVIQHIVAVEAGQPGSSTEKDINELSEKRRFLLTSLKSNLKDLQQAEALAASQPSSMNEKKVYELTEQRRMLTSSLEANLQDLQQAQALAAGQVVKCRPDGDERKLYELSEARKVLLASLESNLKDLQQAQAFASSQPSSMTASKVDELTKKREILAAKLEENLKDLQQAQDFVAGQRGKERSSEKERLQLPDFRKVASQLSNSQIPKSVSSLAGLQLTLSELSGSKMTHLETKRLLPERQPLSSKSAQLDHTLSALLPQDQNTKNDMEQIALRKRLLLANLPSAFPNIPPLPNLPPLQLSLTENEIQELLDKKRHLLTSQKFNLDYLSQAEALAQIQLQQNNIIGKEAQQLPDIEICQKKKIVKKSSISHNKDLNKGALLSPQNTGKMVHLQMMVPSRFARDVSNTFTTYNSTMKHSVFLERVIVC
ncbi:coiled-coil domain-containing protein 7 isoform X4 [Mauremys reevesii]|uniref:coiled-coil domain-containing protein 7 isoform X4 n=1 Tax=Mauremys reevesii TaxID=260615 RepID=UPI00193FC743|nr:coiled-coil domain-containing protein 7 isoform X4 [Mauremys reevesii]